MICNLATLQILHSNSQRKELNNMTEQTDQFENYVIHDPAQECVWFRTDLIDNPRFMRLSYKEQAAWYEAHLLATKAEQQSEQSKAKGGE